MTIGSLHLLTIAAIIATILPIAALSSPILGLDTFLTHQYRRDPQATNDSFLSIPSSAKSSLSFFSHLPSLVPSLLSLSLSVSVHVRLVGPSFPSGSAALLNSFISASEPSNHFHVISPFPDQSHRLSLKHNLHLDVSHATSLASTLSDALKAEIAKSPTSLRSSLLSVPHTVIDDIIKHDFEKEKPVEGIFIYFLDLGSQAKPYAYSYAPGDPSPGYTKCLGSVWTGKDRYLWIDLAAGPVDYGPSISGDGVLPQGEFHPFAALHGRPKSQKALLADLASLVWSAYQVQIVPPLRIPVPFENSLIVQLIHVYTGEKEDLTGLEWKNIERTFMDEVNDGALLLSDQSLRFKTYSVNLKDCAICSYAISKSINSYTSRYLFENYTLIVSEYLDSKRLHQILSDSAQELRGAIGFPEEELGRVLPVYVFDLDYYTVLFLDRYHQTVSFKDMVIAVRTKNTQYVSDYSCNSRPVFTQTRELERPLVGSILQSMWGVAPTHLSWSPTHNDTIVDYSWSIGNTPFGPFSEISTLSFVQKDAARRNVLVTSLNYSITSILDVLESVSAHGGDRKLLKRNQQAEFIQRLNLFKYKLEKAIYALSHFDFELSLYYLRSSDHDLYGIHSLVYHASKELEASLVCFKDPPLPWPTVSVYGACVVAFLYIYKRRERLFRNKRKQF